MPMVPNAGKADRSLASGLSGLTKAAGGTLKTITLT